MSMAIWWVHEATVSTYNGETATGPSYATPVTISCYVDDSRKLVVTATGEQLESVTTIAADVQYGPLFAAGSKVTSPQFSDGRTARVIVANAASSGSLMLPDHVEVSLQ